MLEGNAIDLNPIETLKSETKTLTSNESQLFLLESKGQVHYLIEVNFQRIS